MISRFASWLGSWATTLHIMIFERETFRRLREPLDPDDYVMVWAPEHDVETEGPACISWATMTSVCVHDSCWQIMVCNSTPPSFAGFRDV
jgi:hypothetical protein